MEYGFVPVSQYKAAPLVEAWHDVKLRYENAAAIGFSSSMPPVEPTVLFQLPQETSEVCEIFRDEAGTLPFSLVPIKKMNWP
jgi:hypothetical protein